MQDCDQKAFKLLLLSLGAAFNVQVTPAILEAYWLGLEDLPIDDAAKGVKRCISECEFMPRPVHIREKAKEQPKALSAAVEWERLVQEVRSFGRKRFDRTKFAEPTLQALKLCGGVNAIGDMSQEQEPFLAKRFTAALGDVTDAENRRAKELAYVARPERLLNGR